MQTESCRRELARLSILLRKGRKRKRGLSDCGSDGSDEVASDSVSCDNTADPKGALEGDKKTGQGDFREGSGHNLQPPTDEGVAGTKVKSCITVQYSSTGRQAT